MEMNYEREVAAVLLSGRVAETIVQRFGDGERADVVRGDIVREFGSRAELWAEQRRSSDGIAAHIKDKLEPDALQYLMER